MKRLRQFFCGLGGHDALRHFEAGRVSLLCTSCGHETPGWTTGPPADAAPWVIPFLNVRIMRSASRKVA